MKLLILILLPFSVFAGSNYISINEIGDMTATTYTSWGTCEKVQSSACIELPKNYNRKTFERVNGKLIENADKKAAYDIAKAAKKVTEDIEKSKRMLCKEGLKEINLADMTDLQLRKAVKCLIILRR